MKGELVEDRKVRRGRRKLGVRVWLKKAWEGGNGLRMMEKGRGVEIGMWEWRSERALATDRRAGRRIEVEMEAEKSSPTAMAEMEVTKGRMRRETHEEAEEGDEAKARRRELGMVTRMRTPVELRAARRGSGGFARRTWVMRWERRKRARSAGGRRADTSSPITTPTKGGSPPPPALVPLLSPEFAAAERESEE